MRHPFVASVLGALVYLPLLLASGVVLQRLGSSLGAEAVALLGVFLSARVAVALAGHGAMGRILAGAAPVAVAVAVNVGYALYQGEADGDLAVYVVVIVFVGGLAVVQGLRARRPRREVQQRPRPSR